MVKMQKSLLLLHKNNIIIRGYDWHGPSTRNVFKSLEGLKTIQDLLPPHFECIDSAGGDWVNGMCALF